MADDPSTAALRRTILARIEERLEALGLSDRSVSLDATGQPDAVRNLRRGSLPSVDKLLGLARVLQTSIGYLVGEDRPLAPTPPNEAQVRAIAADEVRRVLRHLADDA